MSRSILNEMKYLKKPASTIAPTFTKNSAFVPRLIKIRVPTGKITCQKCYKGHESEKQYSFSRFKPK